MGVVILVAVFALPLVEVPPTTLYQLAWPLVENVSRIPSLGDPPQILYAYILIVSFILLTIAGIVGVFPLGTGVLGLVGVGLITIPPFLYAPMANFRPVWGYGLYVMLAASIISLGASFLHGSKRQQS